MSGIEPGPGPVVWLASYPKSGNTWLRAMITALMDGNGATPDLGDMVGGSEHGERLFLDELCGVVSDSLTYDQLKPYLRNMRLQWGDLAAAPSIVKTHDRFGHTADGLPLFPIEATRMAILIVRHPLDVAVSYAAHNSSDLDNSIERLEDDRAMLNATPTRGSEYLPVDLGSWSAHTASWLDQRALPMLVLRYEDMLDDPAGALMQVAKACGIDASPETAATAARACSIERLREAESATGFGERPPGMGAFFREGRRGRGAELLSPAQVARLQAAHSQIAERLGYGFAV